MSNDISEFYKTHRMQYSDFYPSERNIIEKVFHTIENPTPSILDIGCACGGLGKSLSEEFSISKYIGIDINDQAISWAKENNTLTILHNYISADILKKNVEQTDIVFSLGCADWNIETSAIIQKSWEQVKENGYLIISLRLTNQISINDITMSYQYIDFFNKGEKQEKANYVIFNVVDTLNLFNNLEPKPSKIIAYGYNGQPSQTVHTIYDEITFAVFALQKKKNLKPKIQLDLPLNLFCL